jgi:hypothetical protein
VPVLTFLRAVRRRIRCELRTEGLHQFDFRSGRCIYCGSKRPRAVGAKELRPHGVGTAGGGKAGWFARVTKNTRAVATRLKTTAR